MPRCSSRSPVSTRCATPAPPRAGAQRDEAAGVGQAEVEQDAVEGLRCEQRERLGERLRTADLDARRSLLAQQLADEEGVAVVVLDEQHPNKVARDQA